MQRGNRGRWRPVAGASPAAFRGPPTLNAVTAATAERLRRAARSLTSADRLVRRGMGDPGGGLQESRLGPRGGGRGSCPGARPAPHRRTGTAADRALWQYRPLSRSPRPFVRQRGVERLHPSQPTPTALRRRPAERLLTANGFACEAGGCYTIAAVCTPAGEVARKRGAEGATAPETLRQKDRGRKGALESSGWE